LDIFGYICDFDYLDNFGDSPTEILAMVSIAIVVLLKIMSVSERQVRTEMNVNLLDERVKNSFNKIKRFPKPSLSPQQADGVLRSASRRKSLTLHLERSKLRGIKPKWRIKKQRE
jgi:predicted RNase H-like HicB family nuclease